MPTRKPLSLSSLPARPKDSSLPDPPGSAVHPPRSFRPSNVLVVLSGSGSGSGGVGISELNKALEQWTTDGFGHKVGGVKAPIDQPAEHEKRAQKGDTTAKVSALAFELKQGDTPEIVSEIPVG